MAVTGLSWKWISLTCATILVGVAISNAQDYSLLVENDDDVVNEKQEPTPATLPPQVPLSAAVKKKMPPKPLVLEQDKPIAFSISDLAPTPTEESTPPLFPLPGPKAKLALRPPRPAASDAGPEEATDNETESPQAPTPAEENVDPQVVVPQTLPESETTESQPIPEVEAQQPVSADDTLEEENISQQSPAQPAPVQEIPTETAPASEKPQADLSAASTELIQERYPNGKVKIARQIIQDEEGNFINHGQWKMLDQTGALIAEGVFQNGQRTGLWSRWYRGAEATLLSRSPYSQFQGPYLSQATFKDGHINGKWTIFDSKKNIISELSFEAGQRHGKAIWRRSGGSKMREADYTQGVIDGKLLEWNPDGKLITSFTYQQGRRLASKIEHYENKQKKTEGIYLHAKIATKTPDSWWNANFAVYVIEGKDEKHGSWSAWHNNGQKLQSGEYHHDLPVGKFSWWYSNGQKALEGVYASGKQQGEWTWWHTNGLKKTVGEYKQGNPANAWVWWKSDGKVAQRADFSQDSKALVPPRQLKQARQSQPLQK